MSRSSFLPWKRGVARVLIPTLAAFAFTLPSSAFAAEPAVDPDDDVVTFARDVAPILQQKCQVCHQQGAIGPMSLTSYEEVRPWARVIKLRVSEHTPQMMPPYHYDGDVGIQQLKHDGRLSKDQIETIVRWVDAGAPMGNPADMPPPVEWPDPSQFRLSPDLGQPDLIVRSDPYTVPATGQDLWWRPTVPTGLTQDRCIRAIEVKPSVDGRAVTHHANSTFELVGPNGERQNAGRLSEYALGKLGEIIPEGTCRRAPANSFVTWDIHYYPSGEEVRDNQVEIGLWLYPEDYEAKYRQTLSLYTLQGDIDLPPHGKAITQGFHSFSTPVRIDSFQPHGHLRHVAMSLEIFYPQTGRREMVSMVSNWNPGWHISHMYEDHVAPLLPAGAVMIITGWYDNTADNPFNPDPDQFVGLGNRTTDEMSHAWIGITHLDQDGYDQLLAERNKGGSGAGEDE
jgi:hypothetical protein